MMNATSTTARRMSVSRPPRGGGVWEAGCLGDGIWRFWGMGVATSGFANRLSAFGGQRSAWVRIARLRGGGALASEYLRLCGYRFDFIPWHDEIWVESAAVCREMLVCC